MAPTGGVSERTARHLFPEGKTSDGEKQRTAVESDGEARRRWKDSIRQIVEMRDSSLLDDRPWLSTVEPSPDEPPPGKPSATSRAPAPDNTSPSPSPSTPTISTSPAAFQERAQKLRGVGSRSAGQWGRHLEAVSEQDDDSTLSKSNSKNSGSKLQGVGSKSAVARLSSASPPVERDSAFKTPNPTSSQRDDLHGADNPDVQNPKKQHHPKLTGRSLFGAGSRSARLAAVPRSSSKILAGMRRGWKPRGAANVDLQVIQENEGAMTLRNLYNLAMKLRASYFVLCILVAPLLLAALFTPLFLLQWEGFTLSEGYDDGWINSSSFTRNTCWAGADGKWDFFVFFKTQMGFTLHVFIFCLSLCTFFGGSALSAMSPSVVLLSNALTLTSQLIFVFVSGAVFARLARPPDSLLAADKIVVSYQIIPGAGEEPKRVLFTRVALMGAQMPELVDVKFSINFRIFLISPTGSFFVPVESLPLIRSEIPILRFGFVVRHVIDEASPLFEYSDEDLRLGDAAFILTVSGMERTSMHPVFYKREFFAHDGDVIFDFEFEDMLVVSKNHVPVFDQSRLHLLKPKFDSSS